MKNILCLLFLSLSIVTNTHAQLANYTGTGGTSTAVAGIANEAVSTLQATGFGANTPCGSGGLSGITVNTAWATYSTAGPHVFIKITPNAGYMLNVTGFTAGIRRSGTGPVNTRFAYSLDNGSTWTDDGTNHAASTGGCNSTLVSAWGGGALPTAITSTTNGIIVALFPFAPGASAGTFQVNTLIINGTVTPSCTAPLAYAVTGGGNYCAGGSGVVVGLANSQSGVNYQLYNGASATGSAVAGTGSSISFGAQTAAGTYTVLATSTPGCTTNMTGSAVITVNPSPSAISGITTLCIGATSTLGNAIAGGTWASSNTAVATIASPSGGVAALTAGTTIITYTLPAGCIATTTVTVNAPPSAISGTTLICEGTITTLGNTAPGGTWTSSTPAVATISTGGVLNGITGGTTTVTYTVTSCSVATTVVTVSSFAPLTGPGTVCSGATITLSSTAPGGVWTSSNTTTATVSAGVVTGATAGVVTISYTTPGCSAATAPVTVNPMPSAISGSTNICMGSVYTLSNTAPGGTWTSTKPAIAAIGASNGIMSAITTGTAVITYTLPGGCFTTAIVTVNPAPGAISGPSTVCNGQTITMSNSLAGGVWSATANITIDPASGIATGAAAGTATISYTTTGCTTVTTAVTVHPLAPITGLTTLCMGYTTTLGNTVAGGAWSSNNTSIASITTGTGIVTPVSAGTAVITYLLYTGCATSITVTVNTLGPITGNLSVCQGSTTTLTNIIPGGTWAATPASVATAATISATNGVVTGVAPGAATVSYSLPSGCVAYATLLVNAVPAPITGPSAVCVNATITMADATAGGSWSAAGTALSISTTGVATGTTAGNDVITYTLPTTCYATKAITVNPLPAAITPTTPYVCAGNAIILSNATGGGTWSSANTAVAIIGSASGVATGLSGGISTITYKLTTTGCYITEILHVSTPPATIVGTNKVCEASTVTLTNTVPGGVWTSSLTSAATVGSSSGIVTGVSSGIVIISYTTLSCTPQLYQVTVNPQPAPIIGFGSVCVGYTTTLSDATPGGTWSSSDTFATVTSSGVVYGHAYGNVTIYYTLPTGCNRPAPIVVDSLPADITGIDSVCPGASVTLSNLSPGGIWSSSNGTTATAIAATGEIIGVNPGTVNITYALISGCFKKLPFTVTTPFPSSVSISQSPSGGPLCEGTPVTFTAHPVNGGSATYEWRLFGGHLDSGATITYTPHHGDYLMVIMSPQNICATPAAPKDSTTMIVYPLAGPAVTISTNFLPYPAVPTPACNPVTHLTMTRSITGDTASINWNPVTGSAGYEWAISNSPEQPSSGTTTLATGSTITGVGTAPSVYAFVRNKCAATASDWASNPLIITYYGQTVTFITDVTFGGTGATYQWYKNHAIIPGATGHTYAERIYHNDTFYCIITSNSPCAGFTTSVSNNLIAVISPLLSVYTSSAASSGLTLYPNPNNGTFTLSGKLNTTTAAQVSTEICDMIGNIIYKTTVTATNGMLDEQIRLDNNLPSGSYLLKTITATETQTFHFTVTK